MVVIDNMANFREKTEEAFDDVLLQISRECTANGMYLLISGAGFNATEIPGKLGENIRRAVSLEMQDKYAYGDILRSMQVSTVPEPGVPGRGVAEADGVVLEFQTCVAVEASDDYNRVEQIQSQCQDMAALWKGRFLSFRRSPYGRNSGRWKRSRNRLTISPFCPWDMIWLRPQWRAFV